MGAAAVPLMGSVPAFKRSRELVEFNGAIEIISEALIELPTLMPPRVIWSESIERWVACSDAGDTLLITKDGISWTEIHRPEVKVISVEDFKQIEVTTSRAIHLS